MQTIKTFFRKVCTKCHVSQDLDKFYRDQRYKQGVNPYCKACRIQIAMDWQKKNPEKTKEIQKKYQARKALERMKKK